MEYTQDVTIRQIQHYLYCPHRWGLLEIDDAWAENYYVVKANLLHERVHSNTKYKQREKTIYTSVPIWNEKYGIYGITDSLEEINNKYTIVEHKPTMPKNENFRTEDALQVFAQKVCVDSLFSCDCKAIIYYADKKKRVNLPFEKNEQYDKYEETLKTTISEIKRLREIRIIPNISKKQNCNGCSLRDTCLPNVLRKKGDIKNKIITFSMEEI